MVSEKPNFLIIPFGTHVILIYVCVCARVRESVIDLGKKVKERESIDCRTSGECVCVCVCVRAYVSVCV